MSDLIAHYTKLQTVANYILPSGTLKIPMGAFLNFNDPKETKAWHFEVEDGDHVPNQLFHERRISENIKRHLGVICFSNGKDAEHNGFNFNRGDYKPRMWAQYGDNGLGVCLIFNRKKLINLAREQFSGVARIFFDDVNYFDVEGLPDFADGEIILQSNHIRYEMTDIIANMILNPEHRRPYLFLKHSDWQEEQEFRIVIYMHTEPEDLYLNFFEALEGITFGCDCDPIEIERKSLDAGVLNTMIDSIKNYCFMHRIECSRIRWTNGFPESDSVFDCLINK